MQLRYQDGFILAEYGSDNKDVAQIEFRSVADGQWHYFAVIVKPEIIRLDVDDLYSSELRRTVADNEVVRSKAFNLFLKYRIVLLLFDYL